MEGQIRFRWTSHPETVLSVFDALLSSEAFDVTLACEGQYLHAHKVVLSACSPYFQELLSVDMNKHPIIFLRNVKYAELIALIQYMYRGEVNITHNELASLLAVAQELKIRGLAKVTNNISLDTIILSDLGREGIPKLKHSYNALSKSTLASIPITHPIIPVTVPHNTIKCQQQSSLDLISSTIPSGSVIQNTPPLTEKSTNSTRISSSTNSTRISSQRQWSQMIDPLLNVDIQPTSRSSSGVSSSSMYDSLESLSQNDRYESHPIIIVEDYGHAGMIKKPEAMYRQGNMKMEEMVEVENVQVDLNQEQNNSMTQSGFSNEWKMDSVNCEIEDDGDMTFGLVYDDIKVPSGSDTNSQGGTN